MAAAPVVAPVWVHRAVLELLHVESIADHGGMPGVRDAGLLESALLHPVTRHHYEGIVDIPSLAATYAAAVAGNHAFFDGNKRAAFLAALVFAALNGVRVVADEAEAGAAMLALAAGELTEEEYAEWLRRHSTWPIHS